MRKIRILLFAILIIVITYIGFKYMVNKTKNKNNKTGVEDMNKLNPVEEDMKKLKDLDIETTDCIVSVRNHMGISDVEITDEVLRKKILHLVKEEVLSQDKIIHHREVDFMASRNLIKISNLQDREYIISFFESSSDRTAVVIERENGLEYYLSQNDLYDYIANSIRESNETKILVEENIKKLKELDVETTDCIVSVTGDSDEQPYVEVTDKDIRKNLLYLVKEVVSQKKIVLYNEEYISPASGKKVKINNLDAGEYIISFSIHYVNAYVDGGAEVVTVKTDDGLEYYNQNNNLYHYVSAAIEENGKTK